MKILNVTWDGIQDPTGYLFSFAKSLSCAVKHSPWPEYAEDIVATSGFAFRMWVTPDLCPSATSIWEFRMQKSWVENGGFTAEYVERLWGVEAEQEEARRREAVETVKRSIDRGIPAVSWDIGVPEWGLITGYDDAAATFATLSITGEGDQPYTLLGKRELPILSVLTLCGRTGKPEEAVLRDTMHLAVSHLGGEEWCENAKGLDAYPALHPAVRDGFPPGSLLEPGVFPRHLRSAQILCLAVFRQNGAGGSRRRLQTHIRGLARGLSDQNRAGLYPAGGAGTDRGPAEIGRKGGTAGVRANARADGAGLIRSGFAPKTGGAEWTNPIIWHMRSGIRRHLPAGIDYWGHDPGDTTLAEALDGWVKANRLSDRRVIEFACGEGAAGILLSRLGCRYLGVDIAPSAVEKTKQRLAGFQNAQVRLLDMVTQAAGDEYDAALDCSGLHMLVTDQDRRAYLRNAFHSLKPGAPMLFFRELYQENAYTAPAAPTRNGRPSPATITIRRSSATDAPETGTSPSGSR